MRTGNGGVRDALLASTLRSPVLVDTHAHLYLPAFDTDRDAVVARAHAAGVTRMLLPAVDVASIPLALRLCDRYEGIYAMAALHPCYVAEAAEGDLEQVAAALEDPRIVGVGETGLDYYWSLEAVDQQQASLRAHARLAMATGLPLSLHVRDAAGETGCLSDTLRILREEREAHPEGDRLAGVFHCFGGPAEFVADVLDLGFYVGLGGTLTYKKSGVADAIQDIPLDRIVLETDAPYLSPTPHRGTRNEPGYTRLVAETLAKSRDVTLQAVARHTTQNAERLFGLPKRG